MKKIKYTQWSKKEIELYKKEQLIKEADRENITNRSLIALRRKYHSDIKGNYHLEDELQKLNNYIKTKKIKDIVKVIHYWIAEIE